MAKVVVVERGGALDAIGVAPLGVPAVCDLARTVLREQRSRLSALVGPEWTQAMTEVETREAQTLTRALDGIPAERWTMPASWDAPRSVTALAAGLQAT